jgi:hypothetical protein
MIVMRPLMNVEAPGERLCSNPPLIAMIETHRSKLTFNRKTLCVAVLPCKIVKRLHAFH